MSFICTCVVRVVCRQMGFVDGEPGQYGPGAATQLIWLSGVDCDGREEELASCPPGNWGPHPDCDHDDDAGVRCLSGQ